MRCILTSTDAYRPIDSCAMKCITRKAAASMPTNLITNVYNLTYITWAASTQLLLGVFSHITQ